MKEKNGFTLIEVLITIALMVMAGVVIANNLTSMFSKQEDTNLEDFKNTLESAACVYIDLSNPEAKTLKDTCKKNGCTLNTRTLIENGLIEDDLVNPLDGKAIDGSEIIKIFYDNGEKKCSLVER